MSRKQLPKAIVRPGAQRRDAAADKNKEDANEETAAPQDVAAHDKVEAEVVSASADASPPLTGEILPAASAELDPQAASRRSRAEKIVRRYRIYAAMGGLVPLPIANIAGVTAIIMRMVKALSDLYQVPFERDRTRSFVIGLMGGAVPTGLATATSSTLAFVVPGSALVGLAVCSITAAAFTHGIGLVFVEHFESTAGPLALPPPTAPEQDQNQPARQSG